MAYDNYTFKNYSTLTNIEFPFGLFMYDKNTLLIGNPRGYINIININTTQVTTKFKYSDNDVTSIYITSLIKLSNGNIIFDYTKDPNMIGKSRKSYLVEYTFGKEIKKIRSILHKNEASEIVGCIATSGRGDIKFGNNKLKNFNIL